MENSRIETIFNDTFSDLKLFYRDTTLPQNLILNYKVGQIIKERGFTDMSYIGGGLSGNLRYLIASSDGRDLSLFNPDSVKTGHYLLSSDIFFKVLDIQNNENKTQVFLLHIPENSIPLFKNSTSNIEEEIIKKAQKRFHEKIDLALIPELQTEDWKERTKAPIGMSENGEMFFDDSKIKLESLKRIEVNQLGKTTEAKKPWWKIWE
ncbi:hypothetical protein IRZ71_12910 [Flavobacterium sp. ANB]|uniref:hypothetical protein n=1 Tax=unclassified Flavobacterium TaxID=196869 RepID=UPI0012B9632C|nr:MULTISPECIES: hypothetical protein [unclassified Flavobacterium]MBF4517257.1 hypothetical protein [Flavobacterium sp. ANB]MTD70634.1 hypothetical protein [Flavobacterium sp. LC2016-13]